MDNNSYGYLSSPSNALRNLPFGYVVEYMRPYNAINVSRFSALHEWVRKWAHGRKSYVGNETGG